MAEAIVPGKRCCTCTITKPRADFARSCHTKDGLQPRCKSCQKAARETPEARSKARAAALRYLHSPRGQRNRQDWLNRPGRKPYYRAYARAYYQRSLKGSLVQKARDKIGALVRAGKLPPAKTKDCARCGKPARHYHHHKGYEPEHHADVIPVCTLCHKALDSHHVNPRG